jgi:hypothetical protein
MAIQRQSRSSAEIRVRASGKTAAGPRICTVWAIHALEFGNDRATRSRIRRPSW